MAAHPPTAAPKLFREEAKTENVQCPACGGPITLHGFGSIERVNCSYCGSELKPEESGALSLLQQVQRQQRASVLKLYSRGTFDGVEWEVLGIVWRECEVDGVIYPWQEFLLFNPYKGYRWLIFSMTDGHWTIGEALKGAPQVTSSMGHKAVTFKKEKFRHFQTVVARTSYVEGEFPWQVRVGDHAVAHEYIAPPSSISIEEAQAEDGADVNFTGSEHVAGSDVWKAFKLPGSPPPVSGVGTVRPNPWKKGRIFTWLTFAALFLLWGLASIIYVEGRDPKTVLSKSGAPFEPISMDVQIAEKGESTTLEFDFSPRPLSNAWAYADVMLISQDSEQAVGFGVTAEEWHGVSGGESWREGNTTPSVLVGGVPGGKYTLQIVPQAGQTGPNAKEPPKDLKLNMKLRQDVVLARYIMIPFFVIIAFPILYFMFGAFFEGRRWSNSDYAQGG